MKCKKPMQNNRKQSRRNLLRSALTNGTLLSAGIANLPAAAADNGGESQVTTTNQNGSAGAITDVGHIRVGHFTDKRRPTGCTVLLFEDGVVAGVDVRGAAPGTRETDLLNPVNSVQKIHAIVLSGGSAFGLDAASGVMRFLEEKKIGFPVGPAIVPVVPAAILFDLQLGDPHIHPDAQAGYQACQKAMASAPGEGCVGAGAGATVGKLFGGQFAMKAGLGTASVRVGKTGLIVGAIVAVNAVGDVFDRKTGAILAGARSEDNKSFRNTMAEIMNGHFVEAKEGTNTVIGVVATNATLTKSQVTKVAQMAHDGFARTINPTHTPYDGDTIFAAATGILALPVHVTAVGAIAAEVMAEAVNQAVRTATSLPGLPAFRDFQASRG